MTSVIQVWNMALGRLGTHQFVSSPSDQTQLAGTCRAFWDEARRACLAEFDWPFAKVLVPLARTPNCAPPPWAYEYARPPCIKVRAIAIPQLQGPASADTILSGTASYIDFGGSILSPGGQVYQGLATPNIGANPSPTVIPFTTGAVAQLTVSQITQYEQITMGGGGGGSPTGGGGDCVFGGGGGYDTGQPTIQTVTVAAAIQQPGGVVPVIWTNAAPGCAAWCTIDVTDPNGWEPGFVNTLSWFLAAEIAVNITGSASVQQAMMAGAQQALERASATEGNEETQVASWNADWIDARSTYTGNLGYGTGYY